MQRRRNILRSYPGWAVRFSRPSDRLTPESHILAWRRIEEKRPIAGAGVHGALEDRLTATAHFGDGRVGLGTP